MSKTLRAFGLAIGATIARVSTFDRKSYFYPDSPRNFQITQFPFFVKKIPQEL